VVEKVRRVAFDQSEGVVKAQNSPAVVFHRLCVRVVEDRTSETLTVNQLAAVDYSASFRQPSIRPKLQP
jgi:hypothetical protein